MPNLRTLHTLLFVTYQDYGCWSESAPRGKISGGSRKYRKGVDHRKGGSARKGGCKVVPSYVGGLRFGKD